MKKEKLNNLEFKLITIEAIAQKCALKEMLSKKV